MNLISVIPLSRSKLSDTLSYFTASDVPVGAIVTVPLRSKSIHAIVSECRPAESLKSEIKRASFETRKLGKVRATAFFPAPFMRSCATLANYYAASIGMIIDALVPDALLDNASKIAPPLMPSHPTVDETYAVQGNDDDRFGSWRSLIRQEFARKKSVAFYLPTIEEASEAFATLEKGIEGYIFLLYGSLTPKKLVSLWKAIAESEHPVVVVATPSFSLLPRSDIETVVIERENGRGWIAPKSPYLDLRRALETIARGQRQKAYLADCLLRTETLNRLEQGEIAEGSPFKWRSISGARDMLVNMKKPAPGGGGADEVQRFRVLSPQLEALIRQNQEESTHLFILASRRGLAPITVCDDCETVVSCGNCSAPMVLHASTSGGGNFFMCHVCGERRGADLACAACGGWRLSPLGIGTDRVAEEARTAAPDADIFRIDADSTKTEAEMAKVMAAFRAKPGSILVGTEAALTRLKDKVEHGAVASLDSLFALPDFRIPEKAMYLLIRLRALSSRSILVQTRRPEEKVFDCALKGDLSDFHRTTEAEREQFGYPPFSTLIKITIEGKKDLIAASMAAVQKLIEPREMDIFPAFTSAARGNSVIHGLIRTDPTRWPDAELSAKLRSLPPGVKVKVDPESLL